MQREPIPQKPPRASQTSTLASLTSPWALTALVTLGTVGAFALTGALYFLVAAVLLIVIVWTFRRLLQDRLSDAPRHVREDSERRRGMGSGGGRI